MENEKYEMLESTLVGRREEKRNGADYKVRMKKENMQRYILCADKSEREMERFVV